MMPSNFSIKSESHSTTSNAKESGFRKLAKTYNLWIAETFHLRISPVQNTKARDGPSATTDIAGLFVPIVKYLRVIGFFPFIIRHSNFHNSRFITFEFRWKSLLTVYSVCFSTAFGLFASFLFTKILWICFTSDFQDVLKFQGYDIKQLETQSVSRVSEIGTRLIPATFPMLSIISVFGTLASLPKVHIVLNQWSIFQREYMRTFAHRTDDSFMTLRQYRNTTFSVFLLISAIAIGVVFSIIENFWGGTGQIFPQESIPKFTATFTMLIMLGGHGSHFLMFRSLMEAFKQIHVGIEMWKRHADRRNEPYDYYIKSLQENAKKWTNIVLLAKKQVETTSRAVALHHVSTIFINFIYLCLGVFSCLSSRLVSADGNRGYILLMFCGWGFSLLTVKALMCEAITEQEKLFVHVLRELEVNDHVPALIQINSLIDLIIREPAVIRFWNVLTLNKSFLIQLIGQVATYLIVLIQFDNVSAKQ